MILNKIKKEIQRKDFKKLDERLRNFQIGSALSDNNHIKKIIHIKDVSMPDYNYIHLELNIQGMNDQWCMFDKKNFIEQSIKFLKEQGYKIEPIKPEPPEIDIIKNGKICNG